MKVFLILTSVTCEIKLRHHIVLILSVCVSPRNYYIGNGNYVSMIEVHIIISLLGNVKKLECKRCSLLRVTDRYTALHHYLYPHHPLLLLLFFFYYFFLFLFLFFLFLFSSFSFFLLLVIVITIPTII